MITANLWFGIPFEAYRLSRYIPDMGKRLIRETKPEDGGVDNDRPVQARVNWGKWIWDCECGGAEFAWDEGLGMCQECYNGKSRHRYRPIIFPKNRAAIEKILLARPLENRNWSPGETLAALRAENEEHKAELIGGGV